MNRQYDYLFKVVLVGKSSVGKSALLKRFVDDAFSETYLPTFGVDFRFKIINVDQSPIKLQIWDTAGQEKFRTISSTYYRGAHAILMIYDITNQQSYDQIDSYWIKQIDKYAQSNSKVVLIGNKVDCQNKKVTQQQSKQYAKTKGIPSYEVSAKTGEGIATIFTNLSRQLMKIHPKVQLDLKNSIIQSIKQRKNQFKIKSGAQSITPKEKRKCC